MLHMLLLVISSGLALLIQVSPSLSSPSPHLLPYPSSKVVPGLALWLPLLLTVVLAPRLLSQVCVLLRNLL